MDAATKNAYDAGRDFRNKAFSAACYGPFSSLYFTPSGDVQARCKSGSFSLGVSNRTRLGEVIN